MCNINYIKSPLNWVGNKFKYINTINDIIKDKQYKFIVDLFMGSGNILLNINNSDNTAKLIGIDKNKLVPHLYNEIPKYYYTYAEQEKIIDKFDRFTRKEHYYTFRYYWNNKYLSNTFNKDFVYETVLLLKMCSNSMVRFNPKEGYFNQGFRGLGKKIEFFTEQIKIQCIEQLNKLAKNLNNRNYKFICADFIDVIDKLPEPGIPLSNLLILDPPYILRPDMYDTDFTQEHDNRLLNLISTTKNDFIYFNYLQRDGVENTRLQNIIDNCGFRVIDINNKTLSGQGRSENIKEVREVIVTNVYL